MALAVLIELLTFMQCDGCRPNADPPTGMATATVSAPAAIATRFFMLSRSSPSLPRLGPAGQVASHFALRGGPAQGLSTHFTRTDPVRVAISDGLVALPGGVVQVALDVGALARVRVADD